MRVLKVVGQVLGTAVAVVFAILFGLSMWSDSFQWWSWVVGLFG